jgi:hypothetical protein
MGRDAAEEDSDAHGRSEPEPVEREARRRAGGVHAAGRGRALRPPADRRAAALPAGLGRRGGAGGRSYCDGFFGRLHWGLAALEGMLLLKLALNWTALLLEAFGAR